MELYNEDCFNIMPQIQEHSVHLILSDIPYNITKKRDTVKCPHSEGRNYEKGKRKKGDFVRF